jgi:hypothetical protein
MYGIFDVALDSDFVLPELPEIATANTIIGVTAGEDSGIIPEQLNWFHHWKTPAGEVCISCAKLADSTVLRFPTSVDFVVSHRNNSVQYFPVSNVPMATVRHLLLDQVIPRILGQQGRLVIHASTVILPNNKTIAFLGDSGRGKSTIASFFCHTGARLMTDDCLLIENHEGDVVGVPNYYGLRLYEDSINAIFKQKYKFSNVAHYSEKKRLLLHDEKVIKLASAKSLDAIFLLGELEKNAHSDAVNVEAITGAKELMMLIEQMFVLDLTDMNVMARQFQNVGKIIATGIPIYRLEYPRKHSLLPEVKASVNGILK